MDWCEKFGGPQIGKESVKARALTIEQVDEEALLIHSQLSRWHKVSAEWVLKKLFRCLLAVATLEKIDFVASLEGNHTMMPGPSQRLTETSEEVHCFYCVCVPDVLSMLINEPLKRLANDEGSTPNTTSELLLYCMALLLDISKFVLRALGKQTEQSEDRVGDAIAILRTLCGALNRETLFHRQRKYENLPFSILCHAHNCTRSPLIATEGSGGGGGGGAQENGDYGGQGRKRRRFPQENQQFVHCYRWTTVLWESFAGNKIWNAKSYSGYDALLELLPLLHRYSIELNEVVLHFLCRALEFCQDEQLSPFVAPCFQYFMQIAKRICEEPFSMRSTGDVFLILEHIRYLSSVFGSLLSRDMERCLQGFVSKVQKKIRKELMKDPSP
ncbi:unnamed protein product [Calypogeia fissa]